jgi:hypothetical protein
MPPALATAPANDEKADVLDAAPDDDDTSVVVALVPVGNAVCEPPEHAAAKLNAQSAE